MIVRRPEQPDRPVQDLTPANILKRPLKLERMRPIKDAAEHACTCRTPVGFYHADGRVSCVRCRGRVEEAEE